MIIEKQAGFGAISHWQTKNGDDEKQKELLLDRNCNLCNERKKRNCTGYNNNGHARYHGGK